MYVSIHPSIYTIRTHAQLDWQIVDWLSGYDGRNKVGPQQIVLFARIRNHTNSVVVRRICHAGTTASQEGDQCRDDDSNNNIDNTIHHPGDEQQ